MGRVTESMQAAVQHALLQSSTHTADRACGLLCPPPPLSRLLRTRRRSRSSLLSLSGALTSGRGSQTAGATTRTATSGARAGAVLLLLLLVSVLLLLALVATSRSRACRAGPRTTVGSSLPVARGTLPGACSRSEGSGKGLRFAPCCDHTAPSPWHLTLLPCTHP